MAWRIEFERRADKQLDKLSPQDAARIVRYLEEVRQLDDPRQRGHALVGEWSGFWRYRVGDYRVIARIEQGRMVIVVVSMGHRREVYR